MLDRLTSMGVFVRVADKGSFTAAADGLNMTPAMVGKHIMFLEDRVGTALLNRTTRRQSLTDAGRAFLESARTILAEVEVAEGSLNHARLIPRGVLRLTAPLSFEEKLAPALVEYAALYPKVSYACGLAQRALSHPKAADLHRICRCAICMRSRSLLRPSPQSRDRTTAVQPIVLVRATGDRSNALARECAACRAEQAARESHRAP
jgi:DNA-binding transcriptional LysR family regulator